MLNVTKEFITFCMVIPLTTIIGLYLSIKLNWIQLRKLKLAIQYIYPKKHKDSGKISSFGALSAVLGGNLGTGNISGMAIALSTGGPGSIFWLCIMAMLGAIIKYASCLLGVKYRIKETTDKYVGGPMYYISKALDLPFLPQLFCIFTICSALTVGNLVQINSLTLPLNSLGIKPIISGILMSMIIIIVILGGLKRFAKVVSTIVPFMAISYLSACFYILFSYKEKIFPSLLLIIQSAFDFTSITGGIIGYSFLSAIQVGFDRGLFATDAGAGLASIIHAPVSDKIPKTPIFISQGLISMLSPIIVMFICTITGLVLIVTNTWTNPNLESTNMCIEAFRVGFNSYYAGHIITITLFFFAFTTILTWSFCADKSIEFLFGYKFIRTFQLIFVSLLPIGAILHIKFIWSIADLSISCMFILNIIAIILLSKKVIKETKSFFS